MHDPFRVELVGISAFLKKPSLLFTLPQQNYLIMKYSYFFIGLALLNSCNVNSKKSKLVESVISSDSITDKEAEYLKTRDAYIEQFKPLQKAGLDTLDRMDDRARLHLEGMLHEILKDSKFSRQGKNNLITLQGYLGFGMMDGLSFEKDSMKIFYTSKNLLFDYSKFNGSIHQLDKLTSDDLPHIFHWTVLSDAFVTNFSSMKLASSKNIDAYVMIGQVGNMSGPGPPQNLFALASDGQFVYVIEKELKAQINELPQCKAVWDSFGTEVQTSVEKYDTAFEHYRKCFQKDLPTDPQFVAIQKQLESMVKYLEP